VKLQPSSSQFKSECSCGLEHAIGATILDFDDDFGNDDFVFDFVELKKAMKTLSYRL
jgi:hypothetical protein